ncbi:STAS/SEC14 domain-containing protein [Sinomonas halotolerans]|uniref:STAS/SEC14 domain-containing protein n=1 Tax=Sinomonas halotolerans TaxID=1644133 RepID=A0ABU9X2R5_9MICC
MEPVEIPGGKGRIALRADGILHLQWDQRIVVEGADARAAMAKVNEICQGAPHPMLVDMATTRSVTREGRAVFSIPCDASRIALLGSSPVDRVIANFFLGVHTPPCPTRFFTSRSEATAWLLDGADGTGG